MTITTTLRTAAATLGLALTAGLAGANVVPFSISGTYSQGGSSDLPSTVIGLGGAGSFMLDPGASSAYFDFKRPGGGTFSTINTKIGGYYFLRSYAAGDIIGAGNFGMDVSPVDDWDSILVGGATAGAWGASHTGYLGFDTAAGDYGWVEYNYTRNAGISTITFVRGAYNDVARADIVAGGASVPEPMSLGLVAVGLIAAGVARRRRA
jgi:hypothetical protein